tara:strand:+ start:768 stop:1856 length:1089 start_codon:yes stop_codon:yes gene_type:complete
MKTLIVHIIDSKIIIPDSNLKFYKKLFNVNENNLLICNTDLFLKNIHNCNKLYIFRNNENSCNFIVENEISYRGMLEYTDKTGHYTVYNLTSEEDKYRHILKRVTLFGINSEDRTNVGTFSLFGQHLEFSLYDSFPLLTSKKVFWKGVVEELLWFIKGETNAKTLSDKGVKIWDANGSREFLDKCGFNDREEGDLGPVYGYQWRNWGGDQLNKLIENIKNDPYSRRHILSAWNVSDLDKMVLPPCHMFAQFYVRDKLLSCQLYQRSADLFLGVPFNIASYGLLTYMIASVTKLVPYRLYITFGDTHVYNTHLDAVKEQLSNELHEFPKVSIPNKTSIDDITKDDIELINYKSNKFIKAPMAV